MTESSDIDTLAVEVSGTKRQYSFKDKHVVIIFYLLNKGNKLKLPEIRRPDEVRRTKIPTILFSIRWFIILLAGAMFLRSKSKGRMRQVF